MTEDDQWNSQKKNIWNSFGRIENSNDTQSEMVESNGIDSNCLVWFDFLLARRRH